jgi:hypothetical protein
MGLKKAATWQRRDSIKHLLEVSRQKIDVDEKDEEGKSALMLACTLEVSLLVQKLFRKKQKIMTKLIIIKKNHF